MKLSRHELRTIYSWCVTYNHCKHDVPMSWNPISDMESLPTGKSMKTIDEWWNAELDVSFEDGQIDKIVSAIIDNTGMEDARCPWGLIQKLRIGANDIVQK